MSQKDFTSWMLVNDFVGKQYHDTYPAISPTSANLSGTSVLITGASKGCGRVAASRFAMAGASRIAVAARSSLSAVEEEVKKAAAAAGHPAPQVLALQLDVTSEESVAAAREAVEAAFGGSLDMLVNNAGYLEEWKAVGESDPAEWWRSWEVNVKGTYLMCRHFMPLVLASKGKTIVNLTSAGAHNTNHGASAYQGSKFAICRFTQFLDAEYRSQGLVAVVAHPGGVRTELALNMPEFMHAILVDEPELAGDTFVWLARERREWLAGRFISCTWDVEELEGKKGEIVERDLLKFRMAV
ncbi:Short chain dehydrogenase family protein [Pleurostoma richardsiae]|uniref:Short chain dehydrogenase family protein n=1 Tax=Pleurostoma richardsiae TaxID=41990 RepID=A0AA38RV67_9PEZI|nr:Short chain dehydrogenase family protein [Pleurostoma richardsiae]